jgi:hypothetical protein
MARMVLNWLVAVVVVVTIAWSEQRRWLDVVHEVLALGTAIAAHHEEHAPRRVTGAVEDRQLSPRTLLAPCRREAHRRARGPPRCAIDHVHEAERPLTKKEKTC